MRTKHLFLGLLACVLFASAKGQEYAPLLENNKVWDVLSVEYIPGDPYYDTTYSTIKYKLMGDTLIDADAYFKLYKSYEEYPETWTFEAYLREDTQKKIWLLHDIDQEEYLLYDFDVNAGDVIEVGIYEPMSLSVDSIAEVEINGIVRSKYWLSHDDYRETWVTGLGSNKGLLYSGSEAITGGWYWLLCVSDIEGLVYANPAYESCYLADNIYDMSLQTLNVYPNPASTKVFFELPTITTKSILHIQDIAGKDATSIMLTKGQTHVDWDCSHVTSGMYFYQVDIDGFIYSGKIVVK